MNMDSDVPKIDEESRARKRMRRHENKVTDVKESPLCVASMATQFLPFELTLNSPRKESATDAHTMPSLASADSEAAEDDENNRLAALLALQGIPLMHALQKERAEDYLRYSSGYLQRNVAFQITSLYAHVLAQADTPNSPVYGDTSPFNRNTQLPKYYPIEDEDSGLSRKQILDLSLESDIWQWYSIANEDFSLLDTLGVYLCVFVCVCVSNVHSNENFSP